MSEICGIDWTEDHHDIALVDAGGQLVAKRQITDDAAGFGELLTVLAEAGIGASAPIPVAIETPADCTLWHYARPGRSVYAINPMAVARYRERHSVAREKSDHIDALTLANIPRTDAHAHRRLPGDSDLARVIAVLARAARSRCSGCNLAAHQGHSRTTSRIA